MQTQENLNRRRTPRTATLGCLVGLVGLVALVLAGLLGAPAPARAYSPIPAYPGPGGVAVSTDVAIDPARIAEVLGGHESPVGAVYSVLYVEYSDRDDRPGPDYGDGDQVFINSVVEAWGTHADTQSGIFIVVSMSNRDVIVHPFSRFASLGWEREAVQRTIDDSPFALHARSGDHAQAILALVHAIDEELAGRIQRVEADGRLAQMVARNARTSVARFEQSAPRSHYALDAAHAHAAAMLDRTRQLELAMARGEWSGVRRLTSRVGEDTARLDGWIERLDGQDSSARRRIYELARERATYARHPRLHDSPEATRRLRALDAALREARLRLGDGDPDAAARSLDEANVARLGCHEALAAAEFSFRLWYRVVPFFASILALGLLLHWLLERRFRSSSRRAEATRLLETLETGLGHAGAKLVELENEHAAFLAGGRAPTEFVGESREPILACATHVDDLFIEFEAATRVAREAKRRLEAAGPFDPAAAERAIAALTTEPVVVRTEQVVERKLLLPDQREVRRLPSELLHELERSYARAREALDVLGSRIGDVHERVAGLGRRLGQVIELADALQRRLSSPALAAAIAPLETRRAAIATASQLDPLGCQAEVAALEGELTGLETLVRTADETALVLTDSLPASIEAQAARISRVRAQQLRLEEPGLDPDATLAEVEAMRQGAKSAFTLGEIDRAHSRAQRAEWTLAELVKKLDDVEAMRATHAEVVPRERQRRASLVQRLGGSRERLDALRAEYADAALMPALDNVVEAETALSDAGTTLDAVATELAPARERWLAAKRQLDRASRALDQVEALYAEIEGKAEELASMVDAVDADIDVARGIEREFGPLRDRIAPLGRSSLADETRAVAASLDALVVDRAAAPMAIHELVPRADALVARAEATRTRLVRAAGELEELELRRAALEQNTAALGASLESAAEDGAEANALFATAARDVASMKAEWRTLLRDADGTRTRIDDAVELLERARERAASDFEAATVARARAATALETMRRAEASLSSSRHGNLDVARGRLRDAQEALRHQRYWEAKDLAEGTTKLVRDLVEEQDRAQAVERERIRRANKLAAQRSPTAGSRSSSSWGSSSRSSSSSSSWGSSSSHRSSRSERSSSFGSSSGSSSFGSSSGRSKW